MSSIKDSTEELEKIYFPEDGTFRKQTMLLLLSKLLHYINISSELGTPE